MKADDAPAAPPLGSGALVRRIVSCDFVAKLTTPCPYCGGKLTAEAEGWEEDEDGLGIATDLVITCETEPDMSRDRAWNNWWHSHGEMDFGDRWMNLKERIAKRLAASGLRYRLTEDCPSGANDKV
jgi:hypothetical protein